jgi:hypothetical protein
MKSPSIRQPWAWLIVNDHKANVMERVQAAIKESA